MQVPFNTIIKEAKLYIALLINVLLLSNCQINKDVDKIQKYYINKLGCEKFNYSLATEHRSDTKVISFIKLEIINCKKYITNDQNLLEEAGLELAKDFYKYVDHNVSYQFIKVVFTKESGIIFTYQKSVEFIYNLKGDVIKNNT